MAADGGGARDPGEGKGESEERLHDVGIRVSPVRRPVLTQFGFLPAIRSAMNEQDRPHQISVGEWVGPQQASSWNVAQAVRWAGLAK
jgi:hypothetical protein